MLKVLVYFGILAIATAATIGGHQSEQEQDKQPIAILKSEAERKSDGSFAFVYEGADGSFRQETGKIVDAGTDEQGIEVTGSYRYYDADGQLIEVHYTAGKNGFIPIGDHIPDEISEAAQAGAEAARNSATNLIK